MKEVQPLQSIALKTETKTIKIDSQLSDKQYAHIKLSQEHLKNVAQAVRKAKNDLGVHFTKDHYDHLILQEKKREFFRQKRAAYFQSLIDTQSEKRIWTKQDYFKFLFDTFQKRFPGKYLEFTSIENRFFMLLLSYFSGDSKDFIENANQFSKTEGRQRFSLDKGIILIGSKGVGKTTIMKLFAMNPRVPYRVVSIIQMAKQLESEKLEGLNKYSTLEKVSVYDAENYYFGHKEIGICIDDMGVKEESLKSWGNERNITDIIVQDRYFQEVPANMTFITTNTEPSDWKQKYDSRTVDRFREMFNVLWYPCEESKRN